MKDTQENVNAIIKYVQSSIKDTCEGDYFINNVSLKDYKISIEAIIRPVSALRQIEVTMPYYWGYKSLNKMHNFFIKKSFSSFNETQKIYNFPFTIWNENIEEYVYKERFNNGKYKMKK